MINNITVSAPGKLLLLGDHTVVYGQPCLVTAMSTRIRVKLQKNDNGSIRILTENLEKPVIKPVTDLLNENTLISCRFVESALKVFYEKFKIKSGLSIETTSDSTFKYGLGSSAAVTVATIFGLNNIYGKNFGSKEIFNLAYEAVLKIQGLGSGFDIAASVFGGILYYVTPGKIIDPLKVSELPLVVTYSGQKVDTVTLVKNVADKFAKNPEKAQRIKTACGQLVNQAKKSILEKDWERTGVYMNMNQEYLRDMGVSTPKLEELISASLKAGAWGAKLSGAGGGDCMICLVSQDKRERVIQALINAGGKVLDLKKETEGVKIIG